ncbi:MAG: aspartate/glutamate racemase family protein [Parvibaculum sp.]
MRLLVVNPNTTLSMTQKIGEAARRVALPGTEIVAVSPQEGPASIEGYFDEALCLAGLLKTVGAHADADAIVIACFDDTGLDAVRCMTDAPVVGIGEAAFHAASFLSNKFAVVTTLSRSVPAIEHNLTRYGLATRCAKVRASEVAVLDLESNAGGARNSISGEIRKAIEDDHAEAIVLGCAGMTDFAASLAAEHGLPVIDGVAVAVALAESLVRVGLKTSRRGGYAPPLPKSAHVVGI